MMTIISLTQSSETNAVLNMLDETLYVVKKADLNDFSSLQPDILLISSEVKINRITLPQGVPIIVIVEKKSNIKTIFEFAQSVNAMGIVEYQELKHLPDLLKKAVKIRTDFQKKSLQQSKALSVMSWKNGVGKSIVALHLAQYLQKKTRGQVLLVDGSLPYGASRAFLNIQTDLSWETIRPALSATSGFTETRLAKNIFTSPYGFDIFSAAQEKETSFLSSSELAKILEIAKEKYDIIIVDFPQLTSDFYTKYELLFDLTVCISTLETPSIYATLKGKETLAHEEKLLFVANQVDSKKDQATLKTITTSLQIPFEAQIEEDRDALKAYQQKYKLITDESLMINRDFRHLADLVAQRLTR